MSLANSGSVAAASDGKLDILVQVVFGLLQLRYLSVTGFIYLISRLLANPYMYPHLRET